MKFEIDNSSSIDTSKLPQAAKRLLNLLKKMTDGKLLTTRTLSEKVGIKETGLHSFSGMKIFDDFKVRYGPGNVWGNKKTISAFKKQLTQE